ncbi:MAG: restriction endonuclease subunit S, partial [Eggerthellaceae bacterium]|nr:restriction endonuclease subunit S [Eggerthellaceae bacterium]
MSRVTLGEVCTEYKGRVDDVGNLPIVGLEHLSQSDIDLLGSSHEETTFTKGFLKGHVLFGRRRAYLKKASLAPFDGVCSGDIIVIEAKDGKLFPGLLPFVIQNDFLFDFAVENSAGSLSPRVKWKDLSRFEFDLPPMEEQERLAELLWAAQETKRVYARLLLACDEMVKSRFIEMFGDPASNPYGFHMAGLTELGSCKNGMNFHSSDSGVELPCLGVADFKDLSVVDGVEGLSTVSLNERPSDDCFLNDGDIVFVRSNGNKELVGRCLAVYTYGKEAVFSGFCIRLRLNNDDVRVPYLVWALKQPSLRSQMFGRGANVQNLNQKILSRVHVPVPSMALQDEFLSFVTQVDKSE